ncbi:hypothetical protein BDP55DRAFT_440869 [Colletotrichum godetiae]|uniref:Uncharacterized protein n=1 Tax=Colletotrichum godetiae TaxID=1209918 RepID=A0AAJ0ELA7_9PEZI|nr:uncharacterized protein BDP55DRAFT_440869 [Colletotrichum godetiae]KAK1657330.1 hypothetical protein BDP55DRAFT_440869 [Colletotrichum godetiae]
MRRLRPMPLLLMTSWGRLELRQDRCLTIMPMLHRNKAPVARPVDRAGPRWSLDTTLSSFGRKIARKMTGRLSSWVGDCFSEPTRQLLPHPKDTTRRIHRVFLYVRYK